MDAITLLKQDHKTVEELFKRFEKLGPKAYRGKQDIVARLVSELSMHASVEETLFYPAIRQASEDSGEVTDLVLESLEEHHIVKWTLSELETMPPDNDRYSAKVTVLMESVRHHVEEEEGDLFPKVRKLMSRAELDELGNAMAEAKKKAPTRPHPRSPDEPPGNLLATPAAAIMDRTMDAGRKLLSATAREAGRKTGQLQKTARTAKKKVGTSS